MVDYSVTNYNPYYTLSSYGYNYPAFRGAAGVPQFIQQPDTVSFRSKEQTQAATTKQGLSSGAKWSIGTIATLGAAALIYGLTKGKAKPNIKPEIDNSKQITELQKQAKELKENIRKSYRTLLEEKSQTFSLGRSPDYSHAYTQLETDKKSMENLLSENEPVVKEFSQKVRNAIKALQNDPEYQELNKLRHQYKREIWNEDKDENFGRLKLINEVIFAKINGGKVSPYFSQLGLSVEDAIKIIKDKSLSNKDISALMYKNVTKEDKVRLFYLKNACKTDDFCLKDLFNDADNAEYAYNNVKRARKYLDGKVAENTAKRIRETRINVAQETRQSEDMKKLKEINKQISELKANKS